jgi:hypothetical protein
MLTAIVAAPAALRAVEPIWGRWLSGPEVSDLELDELRGGLQVGRFILNIGLAIRDSLNGREILSSRLSLGDSKLSITTKEPDAAGMEVRLDTDEPSLVPEPIVVEAETRDPDGDVTVFRQEITSDSIRLIITNEANGAVIARDATLFIDVQNFSTILGDSQIRSARGLSRTLRNIALR